MSNFITGSYLKRFHEPLSLEMIEKLHAVKNKKQAQQQIKEEARDEGLKRLVHEECRSQIFLPFRRKTRIMYHLCSYQWELPHLPLIA